MNSQLFDHKEVEPTQRTKFRDLLAIPRATWSHTQKPSRTERGYDAANSTRCAWPKLSVKWTTTFLDYSCLSANTGSNRMARCVHNTLCHSRPCNNFPCGRTKAYTIGKGSRPLACVLGSAEQTDGLSNPSATLRFSIQIDRERQKVQSRLVPPEYASGSDSNQERDSEK